ncbi:MAG TPA: hypothetical protein VG755_46280 [Nannocystaceae bacterium]|nr:hypothetical protein [Nannocystaceae bacterium]
MRSPALFCTIAVLSLACGTKSEATGTSAADTGTSSGSGGEGDEDPDPSNTGGNTTTASTSASTTMTTSATTAADTGDEATGFILPPDGGMVEPMCDAGMQDCPRGQKCTSYVSMPGGKTVDNTHCVDVIGDAQFGEACTREEGNDDCAAGFFCMTDVSGHLGPGICLEYCTIGTPCQNGGECFAFNDGALPLCELLCDPLIQDCVGGQGCYAAFDQFVCATPGPVNGMGADGDTCATIQGCNPGLVCKGDSEGCTTESGCCTPICDLTGPDTQCTSPGEDCLPALEDPPPNLQDVGYCGVPA